MTYPKRWFDDDANATLEANLLSSAAVATAVTVVANNPFVVNRGVRLPVRTLTSSDTLGYDDYFVMCNAAGGAITVSLPAAASWSGMAYLVKKTDASGNLVTIDPNGSETIDGQSTLTIEVQYAAYWIVSDGSEWFII